MVDVRAADGAVLRTYASGEPGSPAVVIASACGMPGALCEPWLRLLARDHHVVTWETRGMFGPPLSPEAFDRLGHDVAAQAADLVAVLDHHGVRTAHVMGICGGAVVALAAAAAAPARVASLSLWHGDYELGPACAKTRHQRDLAALLEIGAASRADAAAINAALRATAMAGVPDDVASLVSYPYLDDERFHRYCVLTGAIMAADVGSLLGAVRSPALVVTSEDDTTAHPSGSLEVARRLPGAVLRVAPHGDHISAFGASPRHAALLAEFLEDIARAA